MENRKLVELNSPPLPKISLTTDINVNACEYFSFRALENPIPLPMSDHYLTCSIYDFEQ